MLGTELGIWAALPPTQSMCLSGGGCPVTEPKDVFPAADFNTFSKSLLLPQNHRTYFLSPSSDPLTTTPGTPSDLHCHHEQRGTA